MSCVTVRLETQKTGSVSFTAPSSGSMTASCKQTGWFDMEVLHKSPSVKASKVGSMKLNLFLVCSTGAGNYLLVRPTETMYIWVDESIDYDIRSNTDWNIH